MEVGFIIVHKYGKLEDRADQRSVTIWKTCLRLIPNITMSQIRRIQTNPVQPVFSPRKKINSLFHRNQVERTICIRTRQHNDK